MDEEGMDYCSDDDGGDPYSPPSSTADSSSEDDGVNDDDDVIGTFSEKGGRNGSNGGTAKNGAVVITPQSATTRQRKAAQRSAVRSRLQLAINSDDDDDDSSAAAEVAASSGASAQNCESDEDDDEEEARTDAFTQALNSLTWMEKVSADEAAVALRTVGPPYGLQEAALELQNMKDLATRQGHQSLLAIRVGMKIRKSFGGREYHGEVIEEVAEHVWKPGQNGNPGRYVKAWKVKYEEDGDEEELEWDEIYRCRDDRPRFPAPCRGRPLQCLELFCGEAVVSQEFCDRKWKTASIDISDDSNATIKSDIRKVKEKDLPFVPDFIWASPPCVTYSNMAGGAHRTVAPGLLDKSPTAREHDFFFTRMAEIMIWAKQRHPHLIVVIENPVGLLKSMPLMQEFSRQFGLMSAKVDYCAFGRDEMKPTLLWTNDWGLRATLSEYTCALRCPHGGRSVRHPVNVRRRSHEYDFSVIPQPLAEEVASYVDAKFYMDRIRFRDAVLPNDDSAAMSTASRHISAQTKNQSSSRSPSPAVSSQRTSAVALSQHPRGNSSTPRKKVRGRLLSEVDPVANLILKDGVQTRAAGRRCKRKRRKAGT